ncbi:MAG: TIGR02757 family protein [Alistipes sp.]|nr:TIGR02757 family protein [Alistipes sp.]
MVASFSELSRDELRDLLDELHDKYNTPDFIEADPISVPHSFSDPVDREVAGFLAATIAWGNRRAIVQSAHRMIRYMDNAPADFVRNASDGDMAYLASFVHRTFNGVDFQDFVRGLRHIIEGWGSVGGYFEQRYEATEDVRIVISDFRKEFFSVEHDRHAEKHLSSIDKGAACKRIAMYMRWFVRRDNRGVDFGQWSRIPMSALYLPLDLHTGRMGRAMGLLTRKQDDWKAVEEITASLRDFSAGDPTRYDYSLFGAGITKLFDE